jgi:hypothetical protein
MKVSWLLSGTMIGSAYSLSKTTRALGVWQGGLTDLCVPKLFNLRTNPFERGDQSILYDKWLAGHVFV